MTLQAFEPLKPIEKVNFPDDRIYTFNALLEELTLAERHCRDESYPLCSCLPEKHLFLLAGLASEGYGFAEDPDEKEFMRQLQVRARKVREDITEGRCRTKEDYDQLRAWLREMRHRLDQRNWGGEYQKYEYAESPLAFVEVVEQINALTGSLQSLEEQHVDEILSKLSDKHGVPKPKYRFIDKCNPLRDAYQVGYDKLELVKTGDTVELKRTPLTEHDELVFCRGGASPYAVAHEWCHYADRIKKGFTDEQSATKCALEEVGNSITGAKSFNNLSSNNTSGGNTVVNISKRVMDAAPFVAGVWAGEIIDETGLIDTTIGPYTGGFTGAAKAVVGFLPMYYGLTKAKGAAADFLVGMGAPLVVAGLRQQFMPVTPPAARAAPRALTPYAATTGLRYGHPTLGVPMIPPRPGILAPSALPQALAGKWMLGSK